MPSPAINFYPSAEAPASASPGAPAAVILPETGLFAQRADRFAHLAVAHPLGDWLGFLGRLSQAQDAASRGLPAAPPPPRDILERAYNHGMPALDTRQRPASWRAVLAQLLTALDGNDLPAEMRAIIGRLQNAGPDTLERLAASILGENGMLEDPASLPFVAAALQVSYAGLASQLQPPPPRPLASPDLCPCCGQPAVASVVRLGSAINNLRYLHCNLCQSQWNIARATCTHCGGDQKVALHEIAGQPGAVRGESCDVCNSYLKVMYQEKDTLVDPIADDLATLGLDLLLEEAAYTRGGPNFFLWGAHSAPQ